MLSLCEIGKYMHARDVRVVSQGMLSRRTNDQSMRAVAIRARDHLISVIFSGDVGCQYKGHF